MKRVIVMPKVTEAMSAKLAAYEGELARLYVKRQQSLHPVVVSKLSEDITGIIEKSSDLRRLLRNEGKLQHYIDRYNKMQNDLVKMQNEAEEMAADFYKYIMEK